MKSFGIVRRFKAQLLGAGCALALTASAAHAQRAVISGGAGFMPNQPLYGRPYFPNQGAVPAQGVTIYPSYGAPTYGNPVYGGPIYGVPARGNGRGNNVVIIGDNTKVYVDNRGANTGYPYGYPNAAYPGYSYPGYGGGYAGYPNYNSPAYVPSYPPVITYPGYGYSSGNGYGYGDGSVGYDTGYGVGYGAGTYGASTSSVYGQFSVGGGDTRITIGAGQQTTTYAR